jgi:hypothetical protein
MSFGPQRVKLSGDHYIPCIYHSFFTIYRKRRRRFEPVHVCLLRLSTHCCRSWITMLHLTPMLLHQWPWITLLHFYTLGCHHDVIARYDATKIDIRLYSNSGCRSRRHYPWSSANKRCHQIITTVTLNTIVTTVDVLILVRAWNVS